MYTHVHIYIYMCVCAYLFVVIHTEFGEEMCFEACPRDCSVSGWSKWSPCHVTLRCGLGERTRSRYVINNAMDGGRACPKVKDGEVSSINVIRYIYIYIYILLHYSRLCIISDK